MIRLLVADDHEVVREGLARIVARYPDMKIVGEAATGDEVLENLGTGEVDVLLLDIAMPGPGFLSIMEAIRALDRAPAVLVLSVFPEEVWAVRALRAGAAGYLTKGHSSEQLAEAIRRIHRGGRYVTPSLAEKLALDLGQEQERPAHEMLSDREFQVMRLLGAGKRTMDVAAELDLSSRTITTYRARILRKLRLKSTGEIIRYVVDHDLTA